MIYDVIIIGAGISGVMIAHKLAKYNLNVAVAEAKCDVAMGSTRANSAIVHAGFDAAEGSLKAKLNVLGCVEMPEITKQLSVPFNNCGSLVVAYSEDEKKSLDKLMARGIANGVKHLEILDTERLHSMEPHLSREAVSALYAPTAGILCPYELTIAAAENAAINGTEFYFNFQVRSIENINGIFEVSDNEHILSSRYIVNAAGLHSSEIAEIAGEYDFPIKIIPRRGEYMLMDKEYSHFANTVLFSVPTEKGKGILVSPTVDGNLIIGPNAYEVDDKDDTSTTAIGLEEVSTGAKKLIPELNSRGVITSFSGVRATPNIDDFYIEPSKQIKGLLHIIGIESPGLASSPAVGEYAVDLLCKMGLSLIPRENYFPHRNKEGINHIVFRQLSDDEKTKLIEQNPLYGKIVCRCETVTEGEIIDSIHRPIGAVNIDMVKRRTRAGMGRCQGGFCSPRVLEILARELNVELDEITKFGGNSYILDGKTK